MSLGLIKRRRRKLKLVVEEIPTKKKSLKDLKLNQRFRLRLNNNKLLLNKFKKLLKFKNQRKLKPKKQLNKLRLLLLQLL